MTLETAIRWARRQHEANVSLLGEGPAANTPIAFLLKAAEEIHQLRGIPNREGWKVQDLVDDFEIPSATIRRMIKLAGLYRPINRRCGPQVFSRDEVVRILACAARGRSNERMQSFVKEAQPSGVQVPVLR